MQKSLLFLLVTGLISLTAFTASAVFSWDISDDYAVRFSGSSAEGTFQGLTGDIIFEKDNLEASRMDVTVDVATISTGNSTKDKHARGDSWFDAAKYPKIRFQSTQFQKTSSGYSVAGNLTLHGVTKTVTIPFTFQDTANGGLFEGAFIVDRQDYGIEGPWMAFTVGDEFQIDLRVPVK